MLRSLLGALLLILALCAFAGEPDRIALGGGLFTSGMHFPTSGAGYAEFRSRYSLFGKNPIELNPMLGVVTNTQLGVYGYAGLRLVVPIDSAWNWENAAGMGGYSHGSGPNLYNSFEFTLAFSVTRRVVGENRVGVEWLHISNAGFGYEDPGANTFIVLWEAPL